MIVVDKKKLEFFIYSANTEGSTCSFCDSWLKDFYRYEWVDIRIGYIDKRHPNLITYNINTPDIVVCSYCLKNLSKRITVSDKSECFKCNNYNVHVYKLCKDCYYELNHKLYITKLKSILI